MRRLAFMFTTLIAAAALVAAAGAEDETHTYKLEMYDAFGLVEDAEVKVAGVAAGSINGFEINDQKRALVEVELTGPLAVLGDKTQCSTEPQSLIAEYFIDCQPAGDPVPDGATLPKLVIQSVQADLVASTLRLPYRQRLTLLINEFGTALAGNPERLNEAIRLGAPALRDLHKALKLLADQSKVIAQLNVDSDRIIGDLAGRSDDVVAFIREAGAAAEASAARRDDLSTDFDLLDDALRELGPTMAELKNAGRQAAPLFADLRTAAPGLNILASNLPAFSRATERSLLSLGRAADVGSRALSPTGRATIKALADASRNAPQTAEQARLLLNDISDPRRAVAIDDRVDEETGRDNPRPGKRDTRGYTGMEGLLNYFYYFSLALNQYDRAGHFLHFNLYDVFQGPCGSWNAEQHWPLDQLKTQNPATDAGLPEGRTRDPLRAHPCVSMLGPNQPGITQPDSDFGVGPYHPSVCPEGSDTPELCNPAGMARTTNRNAPGGDGESSDADSRAPDIPDAPGEIRDQLEDLLDLPNDALDSVGVGGKRSKQLDGIGTGADQAAQDLLDFLFTP
ncbi:MAG: hypothetical protein M3383_04785 [Actinomycetota bacterium]|nr:hypothetical protein [Actinomycetota bacterium]